MMFWKWMGAGALGALCGAGAIAQQPQVIFSRSTGQSHQAPLAAPVVTAKAIDAERAALTFTAYDLDIHLMPKDQSLAVHARVTVRNDGRQPLAVLPLQLSYSLNFEDVALNGKRLPFAQQTLNSDADHTGQLHEAVVVLPQPLAPQAELTLDVDYSGKIAPSAIRLERLGAPDEVAARSDWDEISESFTGLRGFGDVVWYPVSSVPAALGDGNKLFTEIGRQKLRQADAQVKMRVTEEFFGEPPTIAVLDGHAIPLGAPSVEPTASFPGVITFSLPPSSQSPFSQSPVSQSHMRQGFDALSLFVAQRTAHQGDGLRVYSTTDDEPDVQGYLTAATMVEPLIKQWLGPKPKQPLTILDLPEADDAPFEQGAVLVTGMRSADPDKLTETVAHGLAHAWFQSPRPWLNEGVANFLATLWTEQRLGREAALERLEAVRGPLTLAEPASPGDGGGQDLIHASDAIYYRGKATYVLWMLRDLAGDKPLAAALAAYDPAEDTSPEYFEHLLEKTSGKDLKWFFHDWVYNDLGLPDLSIGGAYPSTSALAGQYLVAIDIANDGYAAADVPVTVRSEKTSLTERVRVPARSKITHRMLIQGNPTEVQVNDGVVPEIQASVHRLTIHTTPGRQ